MWMPDDDDLPVPPEMPHGWAAKPQAVYSTLPHPKESNPAWGANKGSGGRYPNRVKVFEADGRPFPKTRHHILWMLHNCVVHPLLALNRSRYTVELHDLSSDWLSDVRSKGWSSPVPIGGNAPKSRAWWFFHNAVAHPLIGLLPVSWAFKLHDLSAEKMQARGWV